MLRALDVQDLIKLRLELIYAAQKVQSGFVALLSQKHREKNSRDYTADQLNEGNKEIEHAETMLRGSAKNLLPTLSALADEGLIK